MPPLATLGSHALFPFLQQTLQPRRQRALLRAEFGQTLPIRTVMGLDSRLDYGDLCLDMVNLILDNTGFPAFGRAWTEARRYWRDFFHTGRLLLHCCLSGKMRLVVRVIPRIGRTRAVTQIEQTRD